MDYRGDIGVILINHGNEDFIIEDGDRIAQLVIAQVSKPIFVEMNLDDSKRGSGGFGSTGVK